MHSGEKGYLVEKEELQRGKGNVHIVGRERGSFVGKGDVQQERGNTAAKWGNGIQSKEGWEAAV